jgi:hypothetical protein
LRDVFSLRKALKAARAAAKAAEDEAKRLLLMQQVRRCNPSTTEFSFSRDECTFSALWRSNGDSRSLLKETVMLQRAQKHLLLPLRRRKLLLQLRQRSGQLPKRPRKNWRLRRRTLRFRRKAVLTSDRRVHQAACLFDADVSKQVYINWFLTLQQVKQGMGSLLAALLFA